MTLKHIPLVVCAIAAVTITGTASAQFTAAVVPPRSKAQVDTTAKQDSVRRATVALAARVTDMKKWVDSAAGVSIPAADTTLAKSTGATERAPLLRDSVVLARNARIRSDSAASIATVEVHDSTGLKGYDSVAAAPPTSSRVVRGDTNRVAKGDTRTFASGAPAPATASMLPFLAIAGVTTLLAGAALRRP
ncbi:MAG TPA: hypothetical protein VIM15_00100 [Gemmatimonadaceae bacterium]